ncbi:hypothetical protein CYMTET_46324 [Cymbomonas tetramitiformis]|uniref:Uncharacterized protein n=1 Tax=Cymbomonas tetramitiformis TaxID=36881 RepID=A0AAE0BWD3_9CHLO|nr:hypothetical protein CYMTET_46324 [Cymbomonas tetramitiformis]
MCNGSKGIDLQWKDALPTEPRYAKADGSARNEHKFGHRRMQMNTFGMLDLVQYWMRDLVIATKIATGEIHNCENLTGYYSPKNEPIPDSCYDNSDAIMSQICEKYFSVDIKSLGQSCAASSAESSVEPEVIAASSAIFPDTNGDEVTSGGEPVGDALLETEVESCEEIRATREAINVNLEGNLITSVVNEDIRAAIDNEIEEGMHITPNLEGSNR